MTNKKSAKRALLFSIVSLVLCFAMLGGATYAWFTDSVTSGRNIIVAGNLDIELYYALPGDATTADELQWQRVTADSEIFDDDAQWEPGYTQVVYFKAVNEGSLALYYDFNVNVIREVKGVNQAGEEFTLSNCIEVTPIWNTEIENALEAGRDFAEVVSPVVKWFSYNLSNPRHIWNGTLEAGEEQLFGMFVQMPEEISNIANHNGTDIPSIRLGIEVLASQVAAESDSFGSNYDKEAWSEVSGTYEIVDGKVMINSAQELAAFAKDVSAKDASAFNGLTVEILEDIDLGGRYWMPITLWNNNKGNPLNLTINGNGHTIKNMITYGGEGIGFIGSTSANLTVKDLSFDNADVECGLKFAGVVIGYQYGNVILENVHVTNSKVYSTATYGIRIGGLVGFSVQNDGATLAINNCSVTGTTVKAYHSVGGLVGSTASNDKTKLTIEGSASTGNTLVYASAKQGAFDFGSGSNGYVEESHTGGNNTADNIFVQASSDAVKTAITNGATEVHLDPDVTYTLPASLSSVTAVYANGASIAFDGGSLSSDVAIHDATITSAVYTSGKGTSAEFYDCTFTASSAFSSAYCTDMVFENCTFNTSFQAIHFEEIYKTLTVKNCVFNTGRIQLGTSDNVEGIYFIDCTFGSTTSESVWSEKGIRTYSPTTFTGCEFNNRVVLAGSADLALTFDTCTMNGDGTAVYYNDNTDGIIRGQNVPSVTIK